MMHKSQENVRNLDSFHHVFFSSDNMKIFVEFNLWDVD